MTTDPIVVSVIGKFSDRSKVGIAKYGVGLCRTDLTLLDWLEHHQQELMDAVGYIEAEIQLLKQQHSNQQN